MQSIINRKFQYLNFIVVNKNQMNFSRKSRSNSVSKSIDVSKDMSTQTRYKSSQSPQADKTFNSKIDMQEWIQNQINPPSLNNEQEWQQKKNIQYIWLKSHKTIKQFKEAGNINFPIAYHRYDNPKNYDYMNQQYRISQPQIKFRKSKEFNTQFNNVIFKENIDSLLYKPPNQYSFETDQSRIIKQNKYAQFILDCPVEKLNHSLFYINEKNKDISIVPNKKHKQTKGIQLTCIFKKQAK